MTKQVVACKSHASEPVSLKVPTCPTFLPERTEERGRGRKEIAKGIRRPVVAVVKGMQLTFLRLI